jgi:hypothetical protein
MLLYLQGVVPDPGGDITSQTRQVLEPRATSAPFRIARAEKWHKKGLPGRLGVEGRTSTTAYKQ